MTPARNNLTIDIYIDTPDTGLDANTDQTDQPWLTLWQTYYNSMFLSQHDCWIAVWDLIAIMSGVFYRALSTARFYSPSSTGSSRCPPRISFSWWRVRRLRWTACWILRMLTWTWLLALKLIFVNAVGLLNLDINTAINIKYSHFHTSRI